MLENIWKILYNHHNMNMLDQNAYTIMYEWVGDERHANETNKGKPAKV